MDNFTTMAYLLSFPGMIAAVILLTQFTKKMFDGVFKNNKTKYIVYAYALILCVVAAMFHGKFITKADILETILVWMVNSVIVWFAAMKAFETVSKKNANDGTLVIDTSGIDKDTYRLDIDTPLDDMRSKKNITLNVKHNLSQ